MAVHLGSAALAEVSRLLELGSQELAGTPVKWVKASQIHLTLRFLGSASAVDGLVAALSQVEVRPFSLELAGVGAFPSLRNPSVLWAGLGGELTELSRWQGEVEKAVGSLGQPEEKRPFHPHVTLARCRDLRGSEKDRVVSFLSSANVEAEPWRVESFQLMESVLSPKGATYRVLESFLCNA